MSTLNQLTLTQDIEPYDEIDKFICEDILMIVQNTHVTKVVKDFAITAHDINQGDEHYYKKILRCVNALIKANALKRNYILIKDKISLELREDEITKGTNIDVLYNKVDAFVLIEAYFIQLKTSLDLLAQSLKPIYGIECKTFGKKGGLSGMKIVAQLDNNLKDDLKERSKPLIELINENADELTSIVTNRDDVAHFGKLNKVQGFRFLAVEKSIRPPIISISKSETVYVDDYMEETLEFIIHFIQSVIIGVLSNILPDMKLQKNDNGEWGWFTEN